MTADLAHVAYNMALAGDIDAAECLLDWLLDGGDPSMDVIDELTAIVDPAYDHKRKDSNHDTR